MMLPIHEALTNFCKEKILLPFLDDMDDNDNSIISDITTLTGMTIGLGDKVQTKTDNRRGKADKIDDADEEGKTNYKRKLNMEGIQTNIWDNVPSFTAFTGVDMKENILSPLPIP
eukprot:15330273-Ditylum_brightwellii.AAC.1